MNANVLLLMAIACAIAAIGIATNVLPERDCPRGTSNADRIKPIVELCKHYIFINRI